MAVKMRLTRLGDKKSPFYRIVVVDSRKARDGEYIDKVGHYNPTSQPEQIVIDEAKAKDWLSKGVQPTETVKTLLIRQGIIEKSEKLSAPRTKSRIWARSSASRARSQRHCAPSCAALPRKKAKNIISRSRKRQKRNDLPLLFLSRRKICPIPSSSAKC